MKFIKALKTILFGLAGVALIAVFVVIQHNVAAFSLNTGANISVVFTPAPTATPLTWTLQSKIAEGESMLKGMTLKVGTSDISYTEQRFSGASVTTKTMKDPERELALAVLNNDTGKISVVKITKHGESLIAPAGWSINIVARPSGITWNAWNTSFHVDSTPDGPGRYVVVANLYPDETNKTVIQKIKGKKVSTVQQTITYRMYSPYSPDLAKPDLINAGEKYLHDTVATAMAQLQAAGVGSSSIAGSSVYDFWKDKASFFSHLPLLEQTDLTEFILDPQGTTQRVYTIIGANGDQAFANTCNSSSACGWVQFTPPTYKMIVNSYPSANLIKDFIAGAADHTNSVKAAILLYDHNLKNLINGQGQQVVSDPKLEEYLAASYNGSPSRAGKSLAASIVYAVQDWIDALTSAKGGLASETRGYLVKLRYLQTHSS